MSELREASRGRWKSLLPALGVSPKYLTNKHGPCPVCREGTDRFRFDDKNGEGTWICNTCGAGNGIDLAMRVNGWQFAEAAKRIEALLPGAPVSRQRDDKPSPDKLRRAKNELWRACRPLERGDPVDRYLRARGIELDVFPACLRYGERVRYQDGLQGEPSYHPAMVAMVVDRAGKPLTLHRTYITMDGRKANVPKPKKLMLGEDDLRGRSPAIRLAEPKDGVLGTAEGIENALSAGLVHGVPVWAAISSGMLEKWDAPEAVTQLWVFGDNDPNFAGLAASSACAHRNYRKESRAVTLTSPERQGEDWNDLLLRERAAGQDRAA